MKKTPSHSATSNDVLSIKPLPLGASFEDDSPAVVRSVMVRAAHLLRAAGFVLGDAINHLAKGKSEEFTAWSELTGVSAQELRHIKRVAKKVALETRRDFGTVDLLRPLAELPAEEQERWMIWAEENPTSRAGLAKAIRNSEAPEGIGEHDSGKKNHAGLEAEKIGKSISHMAKTGELRELDPAQLVHLSKTLLPAIKAHSTVMQALAAAGDDSAIMEAVLAVQQAA